MSYQLILSDLTRYKTFCSGCDKLIAVQNIYIRQGERILDICESIIKNPIVYWTVKERLESKYSDFGTSSVQITNLSEYLRENLTQKNNDVEELQRLIENHAKFDQKCSGKINQALLVGIEMEEEKKNTTREEGARNHIVPGGPGGGGAGP